MSAEEDQVRWKAASLLTLHQLQDGMYLHRGGEEAESSKRVCLVEERRDVELENERKNSESKKRRDRKEELPEERG